MLIEIIKKYKYLQILFVSFFLSIFPATGISQEMGTTDSLRIALQNVTNLGKKLELLLNLAEFETNSKQSLDYAESAINLADSLRLFSEKAKAQHLSGVSWKSLGDHLKSAERLSAALDFYEQSGSKKNVAIIKRSLGETYRAARSFQFSMETLNQALSFFKSTNDTIELAKTYNRLAATQFELLSFCKGYQEFIDFVSIKGKKYQEVISFFPDLKTSFDSLFSFIKNGMQFAEQMKLYNVIISTEIIYASYARLTFQNDLAFNKYDSIIVNIKKYGLIRELPLVLINKAFLLMNMKQSQKSISLALEALKLANKYDINIYVFLANQILHLNYSIVGDYKNAFKYIINNQQLNEKFIKEDFTLKLKTQLYEHKIIQREVELRNRRNLIYILIFSGTGILIVFLIFGFILLRKNKKQKLLLDELNIKNGIISEKNEELKKLNATKDKFFSIIAHDLRSPFNSIMGFSEIMVDQIKENDFKDIDKYAGSILKASEKSMDLLMNLMTWARSQTGTLEYKSEIINLATIVEETLQLFSEVAEKKSIRLYNQISNNIMVFADKEMMGTIIRNFISNAIKFSFSGGIVSINAENRSNETILSVKDNGIGMDKDLLNGLFRLDTKSGRLGTDNEPSSGLGLLLCKEFAEKHCGYISVESEEGKGSVFYFSIPSIKN